LFTVLGILVMASAVHCYRKSAGIVEMAASGLLFFVGTGLFLFSAASCA